MWLLIGFSLSVSVYLFYFILLPPSGYHPVHALVRPVKVPAGPAVVIVVSMAPHHGARW